MSLYLFEYCFLVLITVSLLYSKQEDKQARKQANVLFITYLQQNKHLQQQTSQQQHQADSSTSQLTN